MELTQWETPSGEYILVLFVRADAVETYKSLYNDEENGYIIPKGICNYKYEMSNLGILNKIQDQAEYFLGHCFSDEHTPVCEYDYLGDYGFKGQRVTLYKKFI